MAADPGGEEPPPGRLKAAEIWLDSYYPTPETGFYYLQSRYYDPKICRFINADGFASTGQGILGNNMFAYCGNNPVMFVDSLGLMPFPWNYWKNPWKKEETNSNMHGTFSVGIAVYTSPTLLTYGGEVALSTDAQGNTEIQFTYASGFTSGEGSSVMPFVMITDAPHVSKLRGFSVATGGVIPTKPAAISLDYNIIPDDANNETYQGITVGMGLGSGEAHVVMGNTWGVECSFNLLSIINNVYYSLFYGAD